MLGVAAKVRGKGKNWIRDETKKWSHADVDHYLANIGVNEDYPQKLRNLVKSGSGVITRSLACSHPGCEVLWKVEKRENDVGVLFKTDAEHVQDTSLLKDVGLGSDVKFKLKNLSETSKNVEFEGAF